MSSDTRPLLQGGVPPPPYRTSEYYQQNHYHHDRHHYHGYNHHRYDRPHIHPVPVVIQPRISIPVVVVQHRGRPRCRFCKALLIAIVIWFLICAFVKNFISCYCGHEYCGCRPRYGHGPHAQWPGYPIPHEVNMLACKEPLRNNGFSRTSFEIDSLDDPVLLFSDGALLHGSVVLTTSSRRDFVKIFVELRSTWDHHADTIVCSLRRRDGGRGVGIFNPTHTMHGSSGVKYNVAVEFPENHPFVKQFETDLVNASHNIDDLYGKIIFEKLSLHGSNGGIKSKSLFAKWADIHTTNGPIEGNFNASDHLSIATLNGWLDVDINLNQDASAKAVLSLSTANAPLKAILQLHDLNPRVVKRSEFQVDTKTSNGRLDVIFRDAPLSSILTYHAVTSNSDAIVALHPTFESHFTLSSGFAWPPWANSPVVNQHHPNDPTGRGRERIVRFNDNYGRVNGETFWRGSSSLGKGEVNIQTSNARVTLGL